MGFFVLKLGFQDPGSVSLNFTEVTSGWLGLLGEGVGAGSWVWALGSPPRPPDRERKKRNEWSGSWGLEGLIMLRTLSFWDSVLMYFF